MAHGARLKLAALAVFALTVAQLLVATLLPDLDQFEGKAFGWRLLAYPMMMLFVPAVGGSSNGEPIGPSSRRGARSLW